MKYSIIILLVLLTAFACRQSQQKTSDDRPTAIAELEKEVLALHDEVMPWMSDMHKLEKQLRKRARQRADSMEILVAAANDLQRADSLMWDWMHAYQDPAKLLEQMDESEVIEYLKKE